jgi:phage gp45-like
MPLKAWLNDGAKQTTDKNYKLFSLDGQNGQKLTVAAYQHYGFTSMPKTGTEVIYVEDNGALAAVAEDDAERPTVAAGGVMVYIDDSHYILLEDGGDILIINGDATIGLQSNKTITLNNGQGSVVIDGSTGQVDINNGNLTVDKT